MGPKAVLRNPCQLALGRHLPQLLQALSKELQDAPLVTDVHSVTSHALRCRAVSNILT